MGKEFIELLKDIKYNIYPDVLQAKEILAFNNKGKDTLANILLKTPTQNDGWQSTTAGLIDGEDVFVSDMIVGTGTSWFNVGQVTLQENAVLYVDLIGDLIGTSNKESTIVKGYNSIHDGGGGTLSYDSSINKETANGITIFDPDETLVNQGSGTGFGCWIRPKDKKLNVMMGGAIADFGITDNTDIVRDVISYANSVGGVEVEIPDGVKWKQSTLLNWLEDISITVNGTLTVTGLNLSGVNVVGGFIWNMTDFSYGTIVSQTTDSVTVAGLSLGATNTFQTGDKINISLLKVGVNIVDASRYSEHNDKFTGQRKKFVNMELPHSGSANEEWTWGQYHPASIVVNANPSDMEKRASNLWRIYNSENQIQSYLQFGINPLNNVDSVANPGESADIILTGGHDEGNHALGVQNSQQLMGWRYPDDMVGSYMGIGIRAQDGYSVYQKQYRNMQNKWAFNAKSTQPTLLEFMNDSIAHDIWRIEGDGTGVKGIREKVSPTTVNVILEGNQNSGLSYINTGALSAVNIYLPDIVNETLIGSKYTLLVDEAFNLQAIPLGASQIRGTTAPNASVKSAIVGETITFIASKIGMYDVLSEKGIWIYS